MKCPRCNEGELTKIQFKQSKKFAFLCNNCQSFWFIDDHVNATTGHFLQEYAEEFNPRDTFFYTKEKDKDDQALSDERKRQEYEKR